MALINRAAALLLATALTAQPVMAQQAMVTAQPTPGPAVAPYFVDPASEKAMPRDQVIALLRKKVKYVFVVFNENHSFDNEFGTFPGANGIYADGHGKRDAAHTPGFTETVTAKDGSTFTVSPIRLGPAQNASFRDSVDHSHTGLAHKLDVTDGTPRMDHFAQADYDRVAKPGDAKLDKMGRQFAQLVMSHIDCDTIPFFWSYANRFVLFDNVFATEDTPSTPNAIAMLAGQAGETQWVKHGTTPIPAEAGTHKASLQLVPLVNDPQPFWGSQFDPNGTKYQPNSPAENYKDGNIAQNLTFASVPLTLAGKDLAAITQQDRMPDVDLADLQQDIPFVTNRGGKPVAWRWYEEGYDHEPYEPAGEAKHAGYVSHHSGPQYFGYIANNPSFSQNMRGLGDFFADMKTHALPKDGGVFYVRGGFTNIVGQTPPIQNANFPAKLTADDIAAINKTKSGNDDHPSYSDSMISEGMAAHVINEIASNPDLWAQSAIIVTYDESDGFYDHVAPRILSYGPDGLPLARGVRIPMIVISPYARTHVISHAEGDHNAVIETLNALYDLPPLASLPEEKAALLAGEDGKFDGPNGFKQHHLGPRDINTPATDDLLSAFDPGRLAGTRKPLPASYAMIDDKIIDTLPHYNGQGCKALGLVPTDAAQGIKNAPPAGFNTLPSTLPGYN